MILPSAARNRLTPAVLARTVFAAGRDTMNEAGDDSPNIFEPVHFHAFRIPRRALGVKRDVNVFIISMAYTNGINGINGINGTNRTRD